MAVEVAKVELKSVQDASGLEERILAGQFTADQVVAVVGKTEGNGGVNDFTRLLADHAFRRVLLKHGKRSEAEVATIPMVWSGGCDGVITPHATVFARNDRTGPTDQARLVIGTAMSAEQICKDLDIYSSVASCSSGVELTRAQIVLMGNKAGAGGRYRIGHSVMKDALDIDGIYSAIRNAGLELPDRPRAEDLKGGLVNCFIKSEADHRARLRGRRQIMLDDSDVHHHRHSKAAVGGVAAAAIGDPAVFVSVDAMHQGPHGGGPVIAIVDVGD